jgi:hypothetical protein
MLVKKQRMRPECNRGTKGRGERQQIMAKDGENLHEIHKATNRKPRSQVYEWATEDE